MKSPSFSTSTYVAWTPEKRLYLEPCKKHPYCEPHQFWCSKCSFSGQTKSTPLSSPIIDAPGRPATAQVKLDCCAKCAAAKWPTQPSWKHRGTGHASVESIQSDSIGLSSQGFLVPGETMKNVVLMLLASYASGKIFGGSCHKTQTWRTGCNMMLQSWYHQFPITWQAIQLWFCS